MHPPAVSERPSGGVRLGSPKWLTNLLASIALMLFGGLVAGPLVGWFERSNAIDAIDRLEKKIELSIERSDQWHSAHEAEPGHARMEERVKALRAGLERSEANQQEIIRRLTEIEKKLP